GLKGAGCLGRKEETRWKLRRVRRQRRRDSDHWRLRRRAAPRAAKPRARPRNGAGCWRRSRSCCGRARSSTGKVEEITRQRRWHVGGVWEREWERVGEGRQRAGEPLAQARD